MSAAIFHLTAAERDTILAALRIYRLIGKAKAVHESDTEAVKAELNLARQCQGAFLANVGGLNAEQIDRLCERLSAPAAPRSDDAEAIDAYLALIAQHGNPAMDMGHWSDFVNRVRRVANQPPQAPEPVNFAERLSKIPRFNDGEGGLYPDPEGLYVELAAVVEALRSANGKPEPVNAELLKAARYAEMVVSAHNECKPHSLGMEMAVEGLKTAIARAESALAAQKGGK